MEMIRDEICDNIIASARKLAREKNVGKVTVRDILKDLGITNRVFYNRFHNINEVLEVLYEDTVSKVRESLALPWDENTDYWEHIKFVASRTLVLSYESRQNMSQYVFTADVSTNDNHDWWNQEIRRLIAIGKEHNYIRPDLDEQAVGYSIWCFIRGFNADAMGRKLSKDDALEQFYAGFDCFIRGMKN